MKVNLKTLLFSWLLLGINGLYAQNFEWAKTIEGTSQLLAVDASGNVYSVGKFDGTVDFDPGAGIYNLTGTASNHNVFIQKVNSNGDFLWAKAFGGSNNQLLQALSIDIDSLGNAYTSGYYRDTIDFDPGTGISNLVSIGARDAFVQKLDSNGNFVWAKSFGGTSTFSFTHINSITTGPSGNVYFTGDFQGGAADFDPGPNTYNLTPISLSDVFVVKLNPSGNLLWAKSFGGNFEEYGFELTTDAQGNVFTTGFFEDTVDFDPGSATNILVSKGVWDVYIQKLDHNGNFLWAKSFGGSSYDIANSISTDVWGNVYTTGTFGDTVDFNPGSATNFLHSVGSNEIFVQKLDTNGNFIWAKSFGGSSSAFANSIDVDYSGNVFTTGSFTNIADFDPGVNTYNVSSSGRKDIFIHKMDVSGNFKWAIPFGGAQDDNGYSIKVDGYGNIYTGGSFKDTVDFDPGLGTNNLISTWRNGNVFIHKISQTITAIQKINNHLDVAAYPNPSEDKVTILFGKAINNVQLTLTDMVGKLIFSKRHSNLLNTDIELPKTTGIYFLTIQTHNYHGTIKLVKK